MIPSRPDAFSIQFGIKPNSYANNSALFSMEGDADVTVEGKKVTIGELFEWLAQPHNVEVTIHPCPQRYGLSLKTEFRDAGPA